MNGQVVADVMVTDVITLHPEDSVERAVSVLLEHHVGGVPVVDAHRRVLGVVREEDLLIRQARLHIPTVFTLFCTGDGAYRHPALEAFLRDLRKALGSTVGEIMDTAPATCAEADTIEEVATRMLAGDLHRLLVVRDDCLVGIVTRSDMLRLLLPSSELPTLP